MTTIVTGLDKKRQILRSAYRIAVMTGTGL
jgi:hypothetical protein